MLSALVKRNTRLFFKDKGMFFSSLITPLILLVLYATFLSNVYRDSFASALPPSLHIPGNLIDAFVTSQLVSSILAVSCVTVAFCSNLLMVQDKVTGSLRDLTIAPVKGSTLALGYYTASLLSTLLVCLVAAAALLGYQAFSGFYMSAWDVLLLLLDVFLLTMFGTALSSIVNHFLRTEGQMSAVGTIVSAGYGFISGAYMPISQFSTGLQKVILFLPGTYGTSLLREHAMRGCFAEMLAQGVPQEAITEIQKVVDYELHFFGSRVSQGMKYLVLLLAVAIILGIYVAMQARKQKKARSLS